MDKVYNLEDLILSLFSDYQVPPYKLSYQYLDEVKQWVYLFLHVLR